MFYSNFNHYSITTVMIKNFLDCYSIIWYIIEPLTSFDEASNMRFELGSIIYSSLKVKLKLNLSSVCLLNKRAFFEPSLEQLSNGFVHLQPSFQVCQPNKRCTYFPMIWFENHILSNPIMNNNVRICESNNT